MFDLRKNSIKMALLFITVILILVFTLGASRCSTEPVEVDQEDPVAEEYAEEEMVEDENGTSEPEAQSGEIEEEPQVMETGPCYNIFFPVEEGRVLKYTTESTGTDPFNYSLSFTNIGESSFTQTVELPGRTINTEWTCSDGGIVESDFRQLDVDDPETGQFIKFETISVEGITFPSADLLEVGYAWSIVYDLEGTVKTPDLNTRANANVAMDFEVIGFEDLEVPAGNFSDALKVAQHVSIAITSDLFENTVESGSTSWYGKNTGLIKNDGSLNGIQTITLLNSISQDKDMSKEEDTTNGYIEISPEEAKDLIDENPDIIIVDVSPYFDNGHLPGAVNYPVGDGTLDEVIPTLDPEATYLIYCHGDSPAITAAQKLVDAGFMNVYRLLGNYAAWVDAGYEVEK